MAMKVLATLAAMLLIGISYAFCQVAQSMDRNGAPGMAWFTLGNAFIWLVASTYILVSCWAANRPIK